MKRIASCVISVTERDIYLASSLDPIPSFINVARCKVVSALQRAMLTKLGIGPGDEVIIYLLALVVGQFLDRVAKNTFGQFLECVTNIGLGNSLIV